EATFKISPSPGDGQTILVTVPDRASAYELTAAVLRSFLLPAALETANPSALRHLTAAAGIAAPGAGDWGVLVLTEGLAESRARHVDEMRALAAAPGRVEVLEGAAHGALWAAVAEFPSPQAHPAAVICRAGGPIARWVDLARAVEEVATRAGPPAILAH